MITFTDFRGVLSVKRSKKPYQVPRVKCTSNFSGPKASLQNSIVSVKRKVDPIQSSVGISDYEKLRLRSIESNRAMMIELGLICPVVKEKKLKRRKEKPIVDCQNLRRSARLSTKPTESQFSILL